MPSSCLVSLNAVNWWLSRAGWRMRPPAWPPCQHASGFTWPCFRIELHRGGSTRHQRSPGAHGRSRPRRVGMGVHRRPSAVLDDREDGLISLLHDAELHQHEPTSLPRWGRDKDSGQPSRQASTEVTVDDQGKPVSTVSRRHVKDQVTAECPAAPEAGQFARGRCRNRTYDLRLVRAEGKCWSGA
jgi:hypothetical protein